jgi:hypothetical protein
MKLAEIQAIDVEDHLPVRVDALIHRERNKGRDTFAFDREDSAGSTASATAVIVVLGHERVAGHRQTQ